MSPEEINCGVALNLIRSFRIILGVPLNSFGELGIVFVFDDMIFWRDFLSSLAVC